MCNFGLQGLAALCVVPTYLLPFQEWYIGLHFPSVLPTLKMATARYTETLEQVQHMMWLNTESHNYTESIKT